MNYAIILAAGTSERFGAKSGAKNSDKKATTLSLEDKLLTEVAGRPIIYYSISAINDHHLVQEIVLVVNKKNKKEIEKLLERFKFSKVKKIVLGGKTRLESLENGLAAINKPEPAPQDLVIVHNGANPCPSYEEITAAAMSADEHGACIVGHKIKSTIKKLKGKSVAKTINRDDLFEAQTPQIAKYDILVKALAKAKKQKLEVTDEAMLLENYGCTVSTVPANENNFKITTKKDVDHLRLVLGEMPEGFRVGIGQDSHLFSKKKKGLTLAGVLFEDQPKLEANSDGDVILHALFNGISQAIGEKSLGAYADKMYLEEGIKDSQKYLEPLLKKLKEQHLSIQNIGVMLECKTPKIDKLNSLLKKSLSKILEIDEKKIGITATSGENATAFGEGLGIQCFCIVSLKNAKRVSS